MAIVYRQAISNTAQQYYRQAIQEKRNDLQGF
jgi:hypothetical protein